MALLVLSRKVQHCQALVFSVSGTYMPKVRAMTIPFERTRALIGAKEFLEAMLDPKQTPKTPRWMRGKAKAILRHYPGLAEIKMAHKALPDEFGPVPPFSRLSGSGTTLGVIDATKDGVQ